MALKHGLWSLAGKVWSTHTRPSASIWPHQLQTAHLRLGERVLEALLDLGVIRVRVRQMLDGRVQVGRLPMEHDCVRNQPSHRFQAAGAFLTFHMCHNLLQCHVTPIMPNASLDGSPGVSRVAARSGVRIVSSALTFMYSSYFFLPEVSEANARQVSCMWRPHQAVADRPGHHFSTYMCCYLDIYVQLRHHHHSFG